MAKDVVCSVDTCGFWEANNRCGAKSIEVNMYSEEKAHSSDDTGCKTFIPAGHTM